MTEQLQTVYLLTACDSKEFYIGSTSRELCKRLAEHKINASRMNNKVSTWARNVGKVLRESNL